MPERQNKATIVDYRLTPGIAQERIRSIAANADFIAWGFHALERMSERGIFDLDVLSVLRQGSISGNPEKTTRGEWKCKVVRQIRGNRDVGVVSIILKNGRLFVKTVEWEDLS